MMDAHDTQWLAPVRATRPGGTPPAAPGCLDDHALARLADGSLDAPQRALLLVHVAGCARCRHAVAAVMRATSDPSVVSAIPRSGRRAGRGAWLTGSVAAGLAAAAVLLVLVRPHALPDPTPHRSAIAAAPAPRAVWPTGAVDDARRLSWTPVPGADRYRVSLYEADGSVRYETETPDTFAIVPDSSAPVLGAAYGWTVDARVGFDRWVRSPLVKFSVRP